MEGETKMSGLYLSAFIDEEENDGVVRIFGGGSDLSGDPSEFLVREPNFCPLAVYVFRHDWRCPGGGDEGGVGRKFRTEEDVRVFGWTQASTESLSTNTAGCSHGVSFPGRCHTSCTLNTVTRRGNHFCSGEDIVQGATRRNRLA